MPTVKFGEGGIMIQSCFSGFGLRPLAVVSGNVNDNGLVKGYPISSYMSWPGVHSFGHIVCIYFAFCGHKLWFRVALSHYALSLSLSVVFTTPISKMYRPSVLC